MQSKPSLLLVIEIGEGVVVSGFLDKKGDLVAFVRDPYPLRPMGEDPWYYEPFDVLYTVRSTINRLLQKKCVSSHAIAGIAVIGKCDAILAWNSHTGVPASPAVKVGTDRLKRECRTLIPPSDMRLIEELTGRVLTDRSPVLGVLKCRDYVAQFGKDKDVVYGPLESWVATSLTQHWESCVDKTMASWSAYTDRNVESWDSGVLGVLRFTPSQWPRILSSTACFARVKGFEPLVDGIPVHCFIHSAQAELLGAQCLSYGDMVVRLGSHRSEALVFGETLPGFMPLQVVGYDGYRSGGATDIHLPPVSYVSDGFDSFEYVDSVLSQFLGQSSVQMVPYQTRDGLRSFVKGLGMQTRAEHVMAGFFESSAYCLRQFLDTVQHTHDVPLKRVVITGDLTQWDRYNQFLSDMTQLPLLFFGQEMLGMKGAGYLLGKELNFFSAQQLVQLKRHIMKQYVPQLDPLSSYATYNSWLDFSNVVATV